MQFIHPYWLFGLIAIAIPVIIHLFNFRRYRKYYFTNLRLLKSIKKETKKQHRIRHLLILLSRILIIVFLSFAFARPYIPGPEELDRSVVNKISIYVDNSMSMQAALNGHSLLDEALAKALEVAEAYKHSDRFQLITNDFEAKHQLYQNRDEFKKLLGEINISPESRKTDDIYERMKTLSGLEDDEKLHFYIISDFQKSTTDLGVFSEDTNSFVFLLPLIREAYENVYIDSAWLATPYNHLGQQQGLHVSFTNASDIHLEKIPVRVMINGKQRALASFDVRAGSRAEVKLPFTNREAGIQNAEISIDDYPITWDDRMFVSWTVKDRIPVMAIADGTPGFYLSSLFSNDSVFNYTHSDIRKLDYSSFAAMDLVVLDNVSRISSGLSSELTSYVEKGGNLFLIPSATADLDNMNLFLQSLAGGKLLGFDTSRMMVTGLNTDHEIFKDVFESIPENPDLPVALGHYPLINYRQGGSDVIMDLQNSDPFISITGFGRGKLYLMTAPAGDSYSNLIRHALWVPFMYKMSMLSRPQGELYHIMGESNSVRNTDISLTADQSLLMQLAGSDYEFIPAYVSTGSEQELLFYDQINSDGHYSLLSGGQVLASFAYNYDRLESDPEIYSSEDIEEILNVTDTRNTHMIMPGEKPVSQSVTELYNGKELWKIFVWLSLIFILVEILLLRLFRK
ncbi:MAG: BatA domain-containing protein [Bacteroidota bacterium]